MLVSPQQLAAHQDQDNLVICDCRFALADPQWGRSQYAEGHIPGAYFLDLNQDLSSPVRSHGGRHPLPDVEALAATLSRCGVTSQTLVVAYDDHKFAFASRLWWLLRYMGHSHVAVLDGGLSAYRAAGLPLTTEVPQERPGQLMPQIQSEMVLDILGVQARQQHPQTLIVDARESERYLGFHEPIDPVAGHIPGAVNYPWTQVVDAQGRLRSPDELRQHWAAAAAAAEVISYCGSGVTACVNLLALAVAGIETGKLYVGSWSDWCSYPLDAQGQAMVNAERL